MITGPLGFYTIIKRILDANDIALEDTVGGRTDRSCIVPGDIAWDECECGQLAGTISRWFLSDNFPSDRLSDTQVVCEAAFVVADMTLSLTRCAPQPEGESIAPTCPKLDQAARILIEDAYQLRKTTLRELCEMKSDDEISDFVYVDQNSTGPGGLCVGSTIRFLVALERPA